MTALREQVRVLVCDRSGTVSQELVDSVTALREQVLVLVCDRSVALSLRSW